MRTDFTLDALEDAGQRRGAATIGGRVFETLRRAIVQFQFRPGSPLSEAEIARQLGISRQPVREAFIKLAEAGLLEVRPQRGTFVRLISVREVENARFIREAIEVAIVRKAAEQAGKDNMRDMELLLDRQHAAAITGDQPGFLRLDEEFHRAIAAAARCEDAWRVLEGLRAQMDRVRFLSLADATPLETLIDQHRSIVEAIGRRSPADAEAAMRRHLSEILLSMPKLAASHPAYFLE